MAIIEVLGPAAPGDGSSPGGVGLRNKVDWLAKSRDWAKWFLKEVQQIPLLLTERPRSYTRSFPSGPATPIDEPKPLSFIWIDEFLPVPEEEWEKYILPL